LLVVQYCPCPLHLDGSQIVGLAGGSTLLERGKQATSKPTRMLGSSLPTKTLDSL
jgi:hypothetical protein